MSFDPFAAISKALPSSGGNYILTGQHLLDIDTCKRVDSATGGGVSYVVEFKVHESSNEGMAQGSTRSAVFALKHAPALSNLRHFLAAANDLAFDDITEKQVHESLAAGQPLKGIRVFCEAFPIVTKINKKEITKLTWHPVPTT